MKLVLSHYTLILILLVANPVIAGNWLVCKMGPSLFSAKFHGHIFSEADTESYDEDEKNFLLFKELENNGEMVQVACNVTPPANHLSSVRYVMEDQGRIRATGRASSIDVMFIFQPQSMSAIVTEVSVLPVDSTLKGMIFNTTYSCEHLSLSHPEILCE